MRSHLLFVGLGLSVVACSEPIVPPASPEVPATTRAPSPSPPDAAPIASAATSAASAEPKAPADVRVAALLVPISESREILDNLPAERVIRATTPELRACFDHVAGPGRVWITGRIDTTGALVATDIVHADVPDATARCVLGALQKVSMGASSPPIAVSVVVSLREPAGSKPTSTEFSASSLPSSDDAQEFGMRGLVGTGEGGGGRGEGIGLGSIGAIGHGTGTGVGQGFGNSGHLGGSHGKPPSVRMGATNVAGRLPPEVIQRIVRQSFGRFRLCYEKGLTKDPNLAGKVAIRFVIETDGSVSTSSREASTDLADAAVVTCVAKAFASLSFPAPEGGKVTVVYPISFSPGDDAKPAKAVAKPSPQKKSIKVAGQPIEKLVAADLVRALRDGGTRNSSVVALDEKAGSPYVVFTESGGEILSIQRVLAPKKGEVPPAVHYELSVFERTDEPAKRYAIRVLGRDAQLAGELTERIVE